MIIFDIILFLLLLFVPQKILKIAIKIKTKNYTSLFKKNIHSIHSVKIILWKHYSKA
jgi:hypothetical protein